MRRALALALLLSACKPDYRPHPLALSARWPDGGAVAEPGRPRVIVLWLPG